MVRMRRRPYDLCNTRRKNVAMPDPVHPQTTVGHIHLKVADRYRTPQDWPRDADGQLAMTNAPLDLYPLLPDAP